MEERTREEGRKMESPNEMIHNLLRILQARFQSPAEGKFRFYFTLTWDSQRLEERKGVSSQVCRTTWDFSPHESIPLSLFVLKMTRSL